MMDLDWNIFAFLSWLELNKEAHTLDGLTINDGYAWYNEQWKCWLKNSDTGWRDNPDNIMTMTWEEAMNGGLTVDTKTAGETTIQFPKPYQPEPYNPNRAALDTMTFKFEQDSNCVDGGEGETLIVEAKSSLGIDGDGGAFYVLRTEQWAISDIDDIIQTLERVKAALDATKPTSIHVR